MEGVGRSMISVVMLTYNREKLVGHMIQCILAQTFRDFEFIIVDNGSTDRSGEVAESCAAKDSRIRVIHRERGNIGSGRNTGLEAARGDYLTFVDDDDGCTPDFLEFLHQLAVETQADVSICGASDKAFDERYVMSAEEALTVLLWRKKYNVGFPTKLFKRSLFEGFCFSETSKYDDIEFMPKMLARAGRVAYHGLPKYMVCRHDSNNSAWTTNHSLLDTATLSEYLSVYRNRTDWLCANLPSNATAWRYFEWSFLISMVEKITRLKLTDCEHLLVAMKQELALNREEFLNCPHILDFERAWMREYV